MTTTTFTHIEGALTGRLGVVVAALCLTLGWGCGKAKQADTESAGAAMSESKVAKSEPSSASGGEDGDFIADKKSDDMKEAPEPELKEAPVAAAVAVPEQAPEPSADKAKAPMEGFDAPGSSSSPSFGQNARSPKVAKRQSDSGRPMDGKDLLAKEAGLLALQGSTGGKADNSAGQWRDSRKRKRGKAKADESKLDAVDEEKSEEEEAEDEEEDEVEEDADGDGAGIGFSKAGIVAKREAKKALSSEMHGEASNKTPEPLPQRYVRPDRMLPRMFYFEPTYLGGNAGIAERLRRLKAHLPDAQTRLVEAARSHPQDFDAPESAGMALTARLATPWIDRPQRVLLQVGLQGSRRYGWRRPPLDVVLVIDSPLMGGTMRTARGVIRAAMARLSAQDRVGVVTVGPNGTPLVVAPVQRIRDLELGLERSLEQLVASGANAWPDRALAEAGDLLTTASDDVTQIPGTQTVWLVTAGSDSRRVNAASQAADALTRRGIVTSVIEVGARPDTPGAWWHVASSGHGNYHRPPRDATASAFDEELESLSKVVARLLRVNVRLAKGVGAIRVVGSRVLDPDEVKRLKAREKAVDTALSKTMGLKADRGDDDDGVQTNIPYFYGGDSHIILVELWVEDPGAVADVTIKYKDMVNLKNATSRVSVAMPGTPKKATGLAVVAQNMAGFEVAELLIKASYKVTHRRFGDAAVLLDEALQRTTTMRERGMVQGFQSWLSRVRSDGQVLPLSEALLLAGRRQIGHSASVAAASPQGAGH